MEAMQRTIKEKDDYLKQKEDFWESMLKEKDNQLKYILKEKEESLKNILKDKDDRLKDKIEYIEKLNKSILELKVREQQILGELSLRSFFQLMLETVRREIPGYKGKFNSTNVINALQELKSCENSSSPLLKIFFENKNGLNGIYPIVSRTEPPPNGLSWSKFDILWSVRESTELNGPQKELLEALLENY